MLSAQGMGFPSISVNDVEPPFTNAVKQGLIKPVFSFWISREPSGDQGGELVLGGVDKGHFKGKQTWSVLSIENGYALVGDSAGYKFRNSLAMDLCSSPLLLD